MNTSFNMKNPNSQREQLTKAELDGQAMGQRFAAVKAIDFLLALFKDTELNQDMFDLYNYRKSEESELADELNPYDDKPAMTLEQFSLLLTDDLKIPFGQAIALSYALGYIDRAKGLRPKDLAGPKTKKEFREEPIDNDKDQQQLTLPGVLD